VLKKEEENYTGSVVKSSIVKGEVRSVCRRTLEKVIAY
jgi:hypothetical protein